MIANIIVWFRFGVAKRPVNNCGHEWGGFQQKDDMKSQSRPSGAVQDIYALTVSVE